MIAAAEVFRLLARYNQWMNGKLYAVCADIPDGERRRNRGAYFKSIHGTLNHLLFGDRVWLGRFAGQPYLGVPIGAELYSDYAALRGERESMDARIVGWANGLSDDWLARRLTYTSNVDGKTRTLPAWVLVEQMFNHQTHHRGQLTTLVSQLGIDPGITDLPWLPEFENDDGGTEAQRG